MQYTCTVAIPSNLFELLVLAGANVNSVSSLPKHKQASLIHHGYQILRHIDLLVKHNFDFGKFMNYRTSDNRTAFLQLCDSSHSWQHDASILKQLDKFIKLWRNHTNFDKLNEFEIDSDGNNALHLLVNNKNPTNLQYILETVFFPENDEHNLLGIRALNHQNKNGDTPLHRAATRYHLTATHDTANDIINILLNYDCDAATKYDNEGLLPIHLVCMRNLWQSLAVMMQKGLCEDEIINATTIAENTPLSLSIQLGYTQCVRILCENENVEIPDMSFYDAIKSEKWIILQCLLKSVLKHHNINDWESIEKSSANKNNNQMNATVVDADFLKLLMGFGSPENNSKTMTFLRTLIEDGFERKDYITISLLLNYNLSAIKLNQNKKVPNVTVIVNESQTNNVTTDYDTHFEEKKHETIDPWIVSEELGKGAFGQVKLGIDKNTKEKVALKFISLGKTPAQLVLGEIIAVQKIYHPNVITLCAFNLNVFGNGNTVMIAFEYAPNGELFSLLRKKDHFDVDLSFHCFEQIVSGIAACHEMGIIHRDLKPQNILIGPNFEIKIADFGLSKILANTNEKEYIVGTPGYKAPELYPENKIDANGNDHDNDNKDNETSFEKACDIFSLSIILWQMLNGYKSKPFEKCTQNDSIYKLIISKDYDLFWKHHENITFLRNGYNKFGNNELIQVLFHQLFAFEPAQRITTQQIQKHKWISHMHKHQLLSTHEFYKNRLQLLSKSTAATTTSTTTPNISSIGSLYANQNSSKQKVNNNVNVFCSSTQPENLSTCVVSSLDELISESQNQYEDAHSS